MEANILVVDDNENMVSLIKDYFEGHKAVKIKYSANDGADAVKIIKENREDINLILLDLIMPKKDGVFVLNEIKRENINIDTIVITSFNEQETIRKVSELGVKYFILKPFELIDLENRMLEILDKNNNKNKIINLHENNMQKSITRILHELGIPSHIKGYQYIREAINLVYENPSLIGGITKELYPLIGNKFSSSSSRVERAIRHAIEVSWNRGDWDLMEEIFGHSVDIDRAKPTNSEFIVTIADKLRLDMIAVR